MEGRGQIGDYLNSNYLAMLHFLFSVPTRASVPQRPLSQFWRSLTLYLFLRIFWGPENIDLGRKVFFRLAELPFRVPQF